MNDLLAGIRQEEFETRLSKLPRLFDLYQRSDKHHAKNYFNFKELDLSDPTAWGSFAVTEVTLARLDVESWERLRDKALPYVTEAHPLRSYQRLWNFLDEARGWVFLADQGYERIEFIQPKQSKKGGQQSPDLFARSDSSSAILEVKTINESDACLAPDASWRHGAITVIPNLSAEFKGKVLATIEEARNQLDSYPHPVDRKIVLLVVRFDHEQKSGGHLYEELESFIASQSMKSGIEVYHEATLG